MFIKLLQCSLYFFPVTDVEQSNPMAPQRVENEYAEIGGCEGRTNSDGETGELNWTTCLVYR